MISPPFTPCSPAPTFAILTFPPLRAPLPPLFPLPQDESEWRQWRAVGDPVLHIELRRWADVLVVAPLSANTLAKMANGLADNLLTCVVRAWDFTRPLLVAPAMNTAMWTSPFTSRHLDTLTQLGANVVVVPPISKRLACGDEGMGAMAAPEDITAQCRQVLESLGLLAQMISAEPPPKLTSHGRQLQSPLLPPEQQKQQQPDPQPRQEASVPAGTQEESTEETAEAADLARAKPWNVATDDIAVMAAAAAGGDKA
ncbi:hypothetical protein VaNZ11_016643 [Volvox africanus]|uniref:phosphopantothenoylcysteine decarboxylase n=1 Tax=Volvox africanus TaxID=51714 RepID=A0ABQ5SNS7_9CHLO|nr:hypothetical protein VaNZ11_016643 [Volvox africanus]